MTIFLYLFFNFRKFYFYIKTQGEYFKIKITKIPLKFFERRTKVKRLLSSCTYFSTLKKFYFYIKILGEYFKRIFKN